MSKAAYKRVLLKLSGEALATEGGTGIDSTVLQTLAKRIAAVSQSGTEIAIVIGGGNIWRHRDFADTEIDRATSDTIGMMATVMNGIALQSLIEKEGVYCRVQTAFTMPAVAEPYIRRRALRHLEKGRVVIFAAGVGQPYFTTDTAAALRALEINADVLLKGSTVDGVYDANPDDNPNAKRFEQITYSEVLGPNLKFMDAAAVSLCRDNELPLIVFDVFKNDLQDVIAGKQIGTKVTS